MAVNKNKLGGALLCIVAAILLVFLMDLCLGGANAWLYHRSKYGIFHRQQNVMNESKDDIIILGSSRASHHYVPSIISDSLGMSCYNAGSEGMCVYYHYAMLASMIERGHSPKIVIYDLMNLDVQEYPGPTFTLDAALDRLAPHYGEYACVDSLFALNGWKEKLKLMFLSYRYNSKLVQSVKCNFIPSPEDNGYEVVLGQLDIQTPFIKSEYREYELDDLKIYYLKKLIDITKRNNITLFMVLSPKYLGDYSNAYDCMKELASENDIVFIDCYNDSTMMKSDYFRDVAHLNDCGAHIWSSYISHLFKNKVK